MNTKLDHVWNMVEKMFFFFKILLILNYIYKKMQTRIKGMLLLWKG